MNRSPPSRRPHTQQHMGNTSKSQQVVKEVNKKRKKKLQQPEDRKLGGSGKVGVDLGGVGGGERENKFDQNTL